MSKVKHAIIADEELYMNGLADEVEVQLPAIHLGGGQEWDDSMLIRGWEAAKEEFHLHHPGPGSWLDKATAALSVGTALAGAEHGDSEWYSATSAVPTSSSTTAAAQANRLKHSKRKADSTQAIESSTKRTRVESPSFTPASPSAVQAEAEDEEEYEIDVDVESYEVQDDETHEPAASGSYPAAYAPVGGPPTSMEDALQKSMQAQWWAGYWYGFYASQAAAAPVTTTTTPSWSKSPYGAATTSAPVKKPYKAHKARRAAKIAEHAAKEDSGLAEPEAGGSGSGSGAGVGSALKR